MNNSTELKILKVVAIIAIGLLILIGFAAVSGCASEIPEPEQEKIYHPLEKHD
jgi:hypothetical protein